METTRSPFFSNVNFPIVPQVLNHGSDGAAGWLQIPPTTMPWGIPMANQPAIVWFTAEPTSPILTKASGDALRCGDFVHNKRKLEDEMDTFRTTKQLITEEKMAARLNEMHISSKFSGQQPSAVAPDAKTGEFSGFKPKVEEENLKRLVLSEEMKNLKAEPIIPTSLLTKLEKPSMALVLWQPPSGSILKHIRSDERFMKKDSSSSRMYEEEDGMQDETGQQIVSPNPISPQIFNNNNTLALDLNSMDTEFSQVCRSTNASEGGLDEMEC